MAQLVARLHGMQKVRGSNPLSSTAGQRPVAIFGTGLSHARTAAKYSSPPPNPPWERTGLPATRQERPSGVAARLLGLLSRLRVVMVHGGSARDGWKRLERRHPDLVSRLEVVPTFSTANRAFIGTPEVRAERMAKLKEAFARTARILQEPDHGPPAHS
jgi:alkanesulfonate monooxygenase SsuD/methylene tetrahydromethanopterin reductase-like flavin-dependent oxidoreductase (luciferase family)